MVQGEGPQGRPGGAGADTCGEQGPAQAGTQILRKGKAGPRYGPAKGGRIENYLSPINSWIRELGGTSSAPMGKKWR